MGNVIVQRQIFGRVTNENLPSTYETGPWDGVFGLGYKQPYITLFDNMQRQNLIKYKQFCLILFAKNERKDEHGKEIGGQLQIGGCTVQPTIYFSLNERRNWEFNLEKIVIQNTRGPIIIDGDQALLDSPL